MAKDDSDEPVLRNSKFQGADKLAAGFADQAEKWHEKAQGAGHKKDSQDEKKEDSDKPAGGFDSTPIPKAPGGYTLKITFHRADNLPFADIGTLSSDPYVHAVLRTNLPKRHKQDPDLQLRIPTIHRNTDPVWDVEWIVANVPASGFFLKCRLYDEDPADHDDRLGNAHVHVGKIGDNWKGFKEQKYELKKRMASKRAYTIRGCAALLSKRVKMGGDLIVSVENLGRTDASQGGQCYTLGPLPWSRHHSPIIGRLAGTKEQAKDKKDGDKKTEQYNFQAIQMQLRGPVPSELYHRYVEFKPFVAGMFTSHSLRGRLLNRALHHQHARIYNYDHSTKYGVYQEPCEEMTKKFLEFVHYDQGGRIFTYVLTLDGLWRFTETGKEFGIDLLSKHTMHSDVSIYIAFSGEFFVRRLKHPQRNKSDSPDPASEALPPAPDSEEESEQPEASEPSKDPKMYELVIDNDSGTYRPNAEKLSVLKKFMAQNLPGLRVVTLDCGADEEKMKKLKDQQREQKKNTGAQITYLQNSSMSSISSSDEEQLEEMAEGREHESKYKHEMHKYLGGGKDTHHSDGGDEPAKDNPAAMAQQQQHDTNNDSAGGPSTSGVINKIDREK